MQGILNKKLIPDQCNMRLQVLKYSYIFKKGGRRGDKSMGFDKPH